MPGHKYAKRRLYRTGITELFPSREKIHIPTAYCCGEKRLASYIRKIIYDQQGRVTFYIARIRHLDEDQKDIDGKLEVRSNCNTQMEIPRNKPDSP